MNRNALGFVAADEAAVGAVAAGAVLANFETMDLLDWLARMSDHIPDPGRHRTDFYAYYAHRVRGDRAAAEAGQPEVEEKPAQKRRCSASWARLISKVFHVDPLTCAKCGGKLEIIAYLHDQVSISRILDP